MATLLKTPPFHVAPPTPPAPRSAVSFKQLRPVCLSLYRRRIADRARISLSSVSSPRFDSGASLRFVNFVQFASGETETNETEVDANESEIQDIESAPGGDNDDADVAEDNQGEETEDLVVMASLQSYKEALANKDESKVAEIEAFLKSIEDEKIELEKKVASLSEELSVEKERILRISADFDNFRKRTDRERLSLVSNAQGEVVENLLPVLDNFERAKAQIKVETEGEEKISNSYQSIYKQFVEIMGSLGVVTVETIGKPFDPMLHEAIMREESTEYEEGIILDEYRKGFKLGDRLLRPSMVKVSAGPGPEKPQQVDEEKSGEEASESSKTEVSSS